MYRNTEQLLFHKLPVTQLIIQHLEKHLVLLLVVDLVVRVRLEHVRVAAHGEDNLLQILVGLRGHRPQHRRSEKNRLSFMRFHHWKTQDVGMDLDEQFALGQSSANCHHFDIVTISAIIKISYSTEKTREM